VYHLQSAFMFSVPFSEYAVVIPLYSLYRVVFITKTECVYCAVNLWSFCVFRVYLSLKWLKTARGESATFYVFAKEELVSFLTG
jgi:hypothetical protein